MKAFNSIKPATVSDRAKSITRFTGMVVGYALVLTAAAVVVRVVSKTVADE